MINFLRRAAIVVLLCGIAVTASAQDAPPQPLPEPGVMSPAEIQKLFDAYIVVEAQRALELSDAQYPQFIARLRTLQETRRRNQQERNQLMQRLQRLTAPRGPVVEAGMIEGVLKSLQELESRNAAELRQAYNQLDQVLEVRQQGRFRVLEEQIERRKIELLMRARQQNRPNARPKIQ
jgi:hypothetical protein